jgi:hypothetical protein
MSTRPRHPTILRDLAGRRLGRLGRRLRRRLRRRPSQAQAQACCTRRRKACKARRGHFVEAGGGGGIGRSCKSHSYARARYRSQSDLTRGLGRARPGAVVCHVVAGAGVRCGAAAIGIAGQSAVGRGRQQRRDRRLFRRCAPMMRSAAWAHARARACATCVRVCLHSRPQGCVCVCVWEGGGGGAATPPAHRCARCAAAHASAHAVACARQLEHRHPVRELLTAVARAHAHAHATTCAERLFAHSLHGRRSPGHAAPSCAVRPPACFAVAAAAHRRRNGICTRGYKGTRPSVHRPLCSAPTGTRTPCSCSKRPT